MMYEINKELLSEVLGYNVDEYEIISSGESIQIKVWWREAEITSYKCYNIYELAHKCKEWAKTIEIDLGIEGKKIPHLITSNLADTSEFGAFARIMVIDEKFTAATEPEAILKACEWIYKQKVEEKWRLI